MKYLLGFLLALAIFFGSLIPSLEHTAYNEDYYHNFQVDYEIPKSTGKSQEELDQVSKDTIHYLQKGDRNLLATHFSDREIDHMVDVYHLFELARVVKWIAWVFIPMISFISIRMHMGKEVRLFMQLFSLLIVFIFLLLAIYGYFFFDKAFVEFHHLFFDNDLWLMDPSKDLMIQMMPSPFFVGMAKNIFIKCFSSIVVLLVFFNVLLGRSRKWNTQEMESQ